MVEIFDKNIGKNEVKAAQLIIFLSYFFFCLYYCKILYYIVFLALASLNAIEDEHYSDIMHLGCS